MRAKPRLEKISKLLTHSDLKKAWKNTVRKGLRKQEIEDLHDYLDVHKNIDSVCESIKDRLRTDTYRVREPEVILSEKESGICRRIVVPSARDSIMLQATVNQIQQDVLDEAPTQSAYYSQSHPPSHSPKDVDDDFNYFWWELWPEYQKKILEFSDTYNFIVVSDISKYYSSIRLKNLKNRIKSLGYFEEEITDLLFYILRNFVWTPSYIPHPDIGLPQINFDAPRLLSHAYLYDLDLYLAESLEVDFLRWMDDFNFGVDSVSSAKAHLKDIDLLLASKGLSLNPKKTKILSPQEALKHFRAEENKRLNYIDDKLNVDTVSTVPALEQKTKQWFDDFYKGDRYGQWGKILKRFFSIFGKMNSCFLEDFVPKLLCDVPSVRNSIFRYYVRIGYSTDRVNHILDYVKSDDCLDDVSLFRSLDLIAKWHIPYNSPYRSSVISVVDELWDKGKRSVAFIAGSLRVLAKYATRQDLWDYISRSQNRWARSQWASRQIAATVPRLNQDPQEKIKQTLRFEGLADGLRVIANLDKLSGMDKLDSQLKSYYFHKSWYPFPIKKVILICNHLRGSLKDKKGLRQDVMPLLNDTVWENVIRQA
jgi:hypothetical protein